MQNAIFIKGEVIKTRAMGSLDIYSENSMVTTAIGVTEANKMCALAGGWGVGRRQEYLTTGVA